MRRIWLLLLAAVILTGCEADSGVGDFSDAIEPADLADAADLQDTTDLPDAQLFDRGDSDFDVTVDNPCPNGQTMIDFPCFREFECIDQLRYSRSRTMGCEDLGYDPRCCGGASCEYLGEGTCTADELCVAGAQDDRCAKKDCGGMLAATCPTGQFCERTYGLCDGAGSEGVCLPRTDDCGYGGDCVWPGCDWECGCDGVTYGSSCERFRAGIARFDEGPCCTPGKVAFDRDNAAAHDGWEACARHPNLDAGPESVLAEVAKIDPAATCTMGGPGSTCSPSEVACRGALAFEPNSTRVTAATWDVVCRIAGFPYMDRLVGRGSPQCRGPLGPVPACGEPCANPCGCEACAFDDRRCDEADPLVLHTCEKGCWQAFSCQSAVCRIEGGETTCLDGYVCAVLSGNASCYPDCGLLLESWSNGQCYAYQGCTKDADCQVVHGGCQVGLPAGCWASVSIYATVEEAEAFQHQWQAMDCGGTICTCEGPKPVPACKDGMCTVPAS